MNPISTNVQLTTRFESALQYAAIIHAGQLRKGTPIPYLSHLLGVTSIVLEHGANEDEAIAALLHDAGEDAGGARRVADIRQRFGDTVADIVLGCTDTLESPKPPYRERKQAYIDHLPSASASVRLVSAADKLHNARSILRDVRCQGEAAFAKFRGGREGTLWYYRAVLDAFRATDSPKPLIELVDELDRVVSEIESLVQTWTAETPTSVLK